MAALLELSRIVQDISAEVFGPPGRGAAPSQVGVLAHIHCLPSTVALVEALVTAGVRGDAIVVIPKPYSTVPDVLPRLQRLGVSLVPEVRISHPGRYDQEMHAMLDRGCQQMASRVRARHIDRVILVDDGGLLSANWYRDYGDLTRAVVSIQQTSSGMARDPLESPIPKIDVSRSAAKKVFESLIVTNGVLRKLDDLRLLDSHRDVGVVGIGTLGGRLARHLAERGKRVLTVDKERTARVPGTTPCASIAHLLARAPIIFGCTGKNWLAESRVQKTRGSPRIFVSCSSRAVEFQTLLRTSHIVDGYPPFGRLTLAGNGRPLHVVENGGFPINFDRIKEWEGQDEIFLTRGLILLAFYQALRMRVPGFSTDVFKLSPAGQRLLVEVWLKLVGSESTAFGVSAAEFASERWWVENSSGDDFFLNPGDHKDARSLAHA